MTSPQYQLAKVEVGLLETQPDQNEMLQIYSLAKIAEAVDIKSRPAPGMFDFAEKAKRSAWQKLLDSGVTPEAAQTQYVELVETLKTKYGIRKTLKPEEKKKLDDAKAAVAA